MGNYILLSDHRGILNRSSCKTFQAREGQKSDSECSAWISQGQILSNQPDCLLQWMTGFVDEGRILDSFILTFSSLMIQSLVGSFQIEGVTGSPVGLKLMVVKSPFLEILRTQPDKCQPYTLFIILWLVIAFDILLLPLLVDYFS